MAADLDLCRDDHNEEHKMDGVSLSIDADENDFLDSGDEDQTMEYRNNVSERQQNSGRKVVSQTTAQVHRGQGQKQDQFDCINDKESFDDYVKNLINSTMTTEKERFKKREQELEQMIKEKDKLIEQQLKEKERWNKEQGK